MRKLWFNILLSWVVASLPCPLAASKKRRSRQPSNDRHRGSHRSTMNASGQHDADTGANPGLCSHHPATKLVPGKNPPTLTISEYRDFQCPYCSQLALELSLLVKSIR
jgi:protein-disulfide isomerase